MFDASLTNALLEKLTPGPERGGLILRDHTLVEFDNLAEDPLEGYFPDTTQMVPHLADAIGTWHTHPDAPAQLSGEDAETFAQWPSYIHAVVGTDGVRFYGVKNGHAVNIQ